MTRSNGFVVIALAAGACGDSGRTIRDASVSDGASEDAAHASLARGTYLVEAVTNCGDCHTPRLATGELDMSRWMSGNDCVLDITPGDTTTGCVASKNLTNAATGLADLTDTQIKNMFLRGIDDDGSGLIPVMPYQVFHGLRDDDADSIVLYLRNLPAIEHKTKSQPPWVQPAHPAALVPDRAIPVAESVTMENGRYLAGLACLECHTPRKNPMDFGSYDLAKVFAGKLDFPARALRLPVPPFPEHIYTWNLTPDPTGLAGFSEQDIMNVLKLGRDPAGKGICPPMPAGQMPGFGRLAPRDAADIAAYLKTIPPIANAIPSDCVPPGP